MAECTCVAVCVCVWETEVDADRSNKREEMETLKERSSSFLFVHPSLVKNAQLQQQFCHCDQLRQRLSVFLCHRGDLGTELTFCV